MAPPHGTPDAGDQTAFMSPLEVGVVIDDLKLVRKLGEGAQGVVFEAHQTTFHRAVAVKLLPAGNIRSQTQVERFKREAEAAGRLNHPNIVATHAFREWRGQHLIVQELVVGGDLEQEIQRRHGPGGSRTDDLQHWAALVCRKLAQALHFAHANGVVHRDVKPGNILISAEGEPKITDFGLAMVEDDRGISRTGVAVGTPYYMSPEQVRAERGGIDHRTDVYSLGAVLYRMLTAHVPFTGKTRQGLLLDILTRDPQPLRRITPDVDRDLEAVCLKCLEKDPADRYPTAQALADDLQRWAEGLGTSARPASVVSLPFRRMRRQATSGLVLLTTLVPVAFVALDLGVLQGAALEDPAVHFARQGALVLATLMFMWPLSVLARRLAGGRLWARLPAAAAALLLGGSSAFTVEQQRLDQLQGVSRDGIMLAAGADQSLIAGQLIQEHIANWESRFGPDDHVVLAYAFLTMGRYPDALEWTLRTEDDEADDDPVLYALRYATFDALGDDEQAAVEEQRLFSRLDPRRRTDVDRYLLVGDILRQLGRYGAAEEAYRTAAQEGVAVRDEIDLALARVHAMTCRWDEAKQDIDAVLRWRGRDAGSNVWAHRIAVGRGDWAAAEEYLARLERWPHWHFQLRYAYLMTRGRHDEAHAYALQSVERQNDPWIVNAAASELFNDGVQLGRADWIEDSKRLYERLELLDDASAAARVGLAAANLLKGDLDLAEGQVRRALELDPTHDIGLYNLSQVVLYRTVAEYGPSFDEWPESAWRRWLDATLACLEVNALLPDALNNAANAQGRLYRLTGDRAYLQAAKDSCRRAIHQVEHNEESRCESSARQRAARSSYLDTLADVHEWAGELGEAVDAARRSVEALREGDVDLLRRRAKLERLEAALDG